MKKSKQRFSLNENCFLIKGAKRGAIYDLGTGEVYWIDETSKRILEKCEKGFPLNQIIRLVPELSFEEILEYLVQLERVGLGRFLKEESIINKIQLQKPKQDILWLELTSACNLKCVHCYSESDSTSSKERLTTEKWEQVLEEAFNEGWRKVHFIGGEPLLRKKLMLDLARKAKIKGYEEIGVFSNGTLLDEEIIRKLTELQIEVQISFYDKDPNKHDAITRTKGSFERTLSNLKKLKEAGVSTRISITVTRVNQENIFETIKFLKNELGIENISYDPVRPIGRGCTPEISPTKLMRQRKKPVFPKVTFQKFCLNIQGHNCFSRFLDITEEGEVYPCIMARDLSLGNVKKESLHSILEKSTTKAIRCLSKDYIETCQDCEFRYACYDCRPMAKYHGMGNLYAKPTECNYNPYLGVWESKK